MKRISVPEDGVEAPEIGGVVPDVLGPHSANSINRSDTILVAIRTGKLDDREFHFTT